MEVAVWTFIVIVLVLVYKAVKYEKVNLISNEKQLIKRYFEIQKISPYHRVSHLEDWEHLALKTLKEKKRDHSFVVIPFIKPRNN